MTFERKIRRAHAWMHAATLAEALARGAVAAALVMFAAAVLARVALPGMPWRWIAAAAAGAAAAPAALHYARRFPSRRQAAMRLDAAHGLDERLVTALHAHEMDPAFASLILADAERHAARLNPRAAASAHLRAPLAGAAAFGCAALAAFWLLPDMDLLGHREATAVRDAARVAVSAEARHLDQLRKELAADPATTTPLEPSLKAAQEIAELQRQLSAPRDAGARDAMARLAAVSDRVAEQKKRLERMADTTGRTDGARSPEGSASTSRLERALRRGDLRTASEEVGRLASRAGQAADGSTETRRMAADLKGLAAAIDGQPQLSAALAAAADALAGDDKAAAAERFDDARKALQDIARAQEEAKRLDRALAELDKARERLSDAAAREARMGDRAEGGDSTCQGSGGDPNDRKPGGKGEGDLAGSGPGKEGEPGREGGQPFAIGMDGGQCAGTSCTGCASCGGAGTRAAGAGAGQGAPKPGQGSGTGSGSASGSGSSMGRDWGVGTTNIEDGSAGEAVAKAGSNRFSEGRDSRWTEEFVKLYAERRTETRQYGTRATATMGEGRFESSVEVQGPARADTPAAEVTRAFLDYREARKDALASEDIPAGHKSQVRDYFDSITPPPAAGQPPAAAAAPPAP